MTNLKKWFVTIVAVCIACACGVLVACGGNDPDESSAQKQECLLEIKVENDLGAPMADIEFAIKQGEDETTVITNAQGTASATVESGDYIVECKSGLPMYHEPDDYSKSVTVNGDTTVTFFVSDNTPDGTQAKPYYLTLDENGQMEITLPANATYYYIAYARSVRGRELVVESEALEITFNDKSYTAQSGTVRAPIGVNVTSTFGTVNFSLKNLSAEDVTLTLKMESPLGSHDNPIQITLDTATAVTVSGTEVVYYQWTATGNGKFRITADSDNNSMSMQNKTTGQASDVTTDGALTCEIDVNAGDVIEIRLSVSMGEEGVDSTYNVTATFTESVSA